MVGGFQPGAISLGPDGAFGHRRPVSGLCQGRKCGRALLPVTPDFHPVMPATAARTGLDGGHGALLGSGPAPDISYITRRAPLLGLSDSWDTFGTPPPARPLRGGPGVPAAGGLRWLPTAPASRH